MAGDSMVVTALSASFVRRRIRKTGYQKSDICGIDTIVPLNLPRSANLHVAENKLLTSFIKISCIFHDASRLFKPFKSTVRSVIGQRTTAQSVDAPLTQCRTRKQLTKKESTEQNFRALGIDTILELESLPQKNAPHPRRNIAFPIRVYRTSWRGEVHDILEAVDESNTDG